MKRALNFIKGIALGEYLIAILFGLALGAGSFAGSSLAKTVFRSFWSFLSEMLAFLPLMFILIGLLDVWVPKKAIERHIGWESGWKGIFWVILLAMFQAGPLYGAFPVAYMLWEKGSSVRNIFIYLGAFTTLKIPMLTFEIGYVGLKFSLLRSSLSLLVFIAIGLIMERFYKNSFTISLPEQKKGIK